MGIDKAVAVTYYNDLPAPFVIAKGRNELAKKLIEIARENGIQIVEEKNLVDKLYLLDIESYIPESLYSIMAEILAFVFSVERE